MHWLDPNYLPVTKGTLHQFLLNPHGDADGMILTDGTEIHFPPHMAKEIVAAIHPGQTVTVHGVKPRDANVIAAVSVESAPQANQGRRLEDQNWHRYRRKRNRRLEG